MARGGKRVICTSFVTSSGIVALRARVVALASLARLRTSRLICDGEFLSYEQRKNKSSIDQGASLLGQRTPGGNSDSSLLRHARIASSLPLNRHCPVHFEGLKEQLESCADRGARYSPGFARR